MSSTDISKLLSCVVILVEDIEGVGGFLSSVFDMSPYKIIQHPCRHAIQEISKDSTVLMIESGSCDESFMQCFTAIAVRHIFVSVSDPGKIQMRATQAGGQVIESNIDQRGGSLCVVEGPEGVIIHIISNERSLVQAPHEIIMSSIRPKAEQDEDEESEGYADSLAASNLCNPRPIIHTLEVGLLSNTHPNGYAPCPPNNRKIIPFETDIFKGAALLLVRTNPIDNHYKSFFQGRCSFEVQVQGKFKIAPQGDVYVGAEVTTKMELGIITRSFCRAILSFASTMAEDLHYSFGDSPDTKNYEIPHLVGPLFKSMDRVVITPAGQEPPPMGVPFYEDLEKRRLRMKTKLTNTWKFDTTSTYSLSVNTFNMDLCSWTLIGIPMLRQMDLRAFWGDASLRLVGYEMPVAAAAEIPDKHPQRCLKYIFSMRVTPVNPAKEQVHVLASPVLSDDEAEAEVEADNDLDDNQVESVDGDEILLRINSDDKNIALESNIEIEDDTQSPNDIGEISPESSFLLKQRTAFDDQEHDHYPDSDHPIDSNDIISPKGTRRFASLRPRVMSDVGVTGSTPSPTTARPRSGFKGMLRKSTVETTAGVIAALGDDDRDKDTPTRSGVGMGKWFRRSGTHNPNTSSMSSNVGVSAVPVSTGVGVGVGVGGGVDRDSHIATEVPETSDYLPIDYDFELEGDLDYCPICLESNDPKREGRRQILYILPLSILSTTIPSQDAAFAVGPSAIPIRLRAYQDILLSVPLEAGVIPIPKQFLNPRRSQAELRRRHVAEIYKTLISYSTISESTTLKGITTQIALDSTATATATTVTTTLVHPQCSSTISTMALVSLLSPITDIDRHFFHYSAVQQKGVGFTKGRNRWRWEGSVFVATGLRHWSEHYLCVSTTDISFRKNRESKRAAIKFLLPAVLRVRPMLQEEVPVTGLYYFQIETFGIVYYVMVRHENHLLDWIRAFTTLLGIRITQPPILRTIPIPNLSEPASLVVRPAGWNLRNQRVMNFRRMFFRKGCTTKATEDKPINKLIEDLLDKVFAISMSDGSSSSSSSSTTTTAPASDMATWIDFMDELSALQTVIIPIDLKETERVACLLNLYHLLVLHGIVVIGPPASWVNWPSFFQNVSYMFNFQLLSLTELEYGILRAAMTKPPQGLSRLVSTVNSNPTLALTHRDFRLNFCLNCGSRSMSQAVPIYYPDTLDQQLDQMTAIALEESIRVDANRKAVILPKMCSWFLGDFSVKKTGTAVPADCLRAIASYLRGDARIQVTKMLADNSNPNIRFRSFNFRCRAFVKLEDHNEER